MQQQSPPKDLSPSKLWAELSALPRPHSVVEFPRPRADGSYPSVAIWVLTQAESLSAQRDAEHVVRKLMKTNGGDIPKLEEASFGYRTMYENEAAVQILLRALREDGDLKSPMFRRAEEVRDLSTDEIGVLMNLYNQTQSSVGPIMSMMTEETYNQWVEVLATGADTGPFVLARTSSELKNDLILRLAAELWSYRTGSISSGPEHDDSAKSADTSELELSALLAESEK